jgi:hypothetical protein
LINKKLKAIILLNVLAGLLFSCGEGIHLLPFPSSQLAETSKSQLQEKNKIPYQPNVLRFDNGKAKYQTKTQRDKQQKLYSNDALNSEKLSSFASNNFGKNVRLFGENRFKSLFLIYSKGSRAPPVFS